MQMTWSVQISAQQAIVNLAVIINIYLSG